MKEMKGYFPPSIRRETIVLEDGVCVKTSYVVKDKEASRGDMNIERQDAGGDGYEFTFDAFNN